MMIERWLDFVFEISVLKINRHTIRVHVEHVHVPNICSVLIRTCN